MAILKYGFEGKKLNFLSLPIWTERCLKYYKYKLPWIKINNLVNSLFKTFILSKKVYTVSVKNLNKLIISKIMAEFVSN